MLDPCLFGPIIDTEKTAVWEVTKNCNLKCPHCCSNSGYDFIENSYQDLSEEKALEYVDIFHQNDIKVIYFSGGEPLLWKPLVPVLKRARSYGIECCLASSGYVQDYVLLEELAKIDIYSIHVSLDSYCAQTHDKFRGIVGAFKRAISFIDYFKSKNKTIVTSTMISNDLIEHFDEFLDLLSEHKVDRSVLNFFVPLGRASSLENEVIPTVEKRVIASELYAKAKTKKILIGIKRVEESDDGIQKCPAGSALVHVNAYGNISPCSWIGKLWSDMVIPMSDNVFPKEQLQKLQEKIHEITDEKCLKCHLATTCGRGCPVIAYFEGKNYDTICARSGKNV